MSDERHKDDEARFRKFIEEQPGASARLPLTHITQAYSFRNIIKGESLEPTRCPHFDEEIIYLFYGRPSYRVTDQRAFSRLQFNWPILFIFKPDWINTIKRVFPFDSGAFIKNFYEQIFFEGSNIDTFQLTPSLRSAQKVVDAFYESEKDYYYGKSTKIVEKGNLDFEIQGVEYLAKEPGLQNVKTGIKLDERASAIEVQVADSIPIGEGLLALIMPEEFMTEPSIETAINRWAIGSRVQSYPALMGPGSEAWAGVIYDRVSKIYENEGYFKTK